MADSHQVQSKISVARWSLLASLCLVIGKFSAAFASGSLGLLSEAFHSLLDAAATAVTLFAIRYADQPADEDHHFGHAKMESVAALIETGLLFGVTGWIVYESVVRLLGETPPLELSWWVFGVVAASIVIDWNRSRALQRTADDTKSDALAADALHFRADMWSSCAVLAGLLLALTGYPKADAAAALIVAGFVGHAAWGLGRRTLATLLDAAPSGITLKLEEMANGVDGVLSVAKLRARPAGPTLFVDLTVNVPRTLPVSRLIEIREQVARAIRTLHPAADVAIETNPVALDEETAFEKIMLIAAENKAAIHHVTVQDNNGKLAVSFDYEVDGSTSLRLAHGNATLLEDAVRKGLGTEVEVESHIEPHSPALLHGSDPGPAVLRQVKSALASLAAREKSMRDVHNIRIRNTESGLFIHYHCRFNADCTVQFVHDAVDRIENALTAKVKNVARVVAHAEPLGHTKQRP